MIHLKCLGWRRKIGSTTSTDKFIEVLFSYLPGLRRIEMMKQLQKNVVIRVDFGCLFPVVVCLVVDGETASLQFAFKSDSKHAAAFPQLHRDREQV